MQSKKRKTILYPLDPNWIEVIFAPFHDPEVSKDLDFTLEPVHAKNCQIKNNWCWTNLSWEGCGRGQEAAVLRLFVNLHITKHDTLLFCLAMPEEMVVRFELLLDGKWIKPGQHYEGISKRMEIEIPVDTGLLSEIRAIFTSRQEKMQIVYLSWFGLQNRKLLSQMLENKLLHDESWPGLIKPVSDWGKISFEQGLIFDSKKLDYLRKKTELSGWKQHVSLLEKKAREYSKRIPEQDIHGYLPTDDVRYIRRREMGKMYCWEALIVGFIGLLKEDRKLMMHALRYLMSMIHSPSWACSAEHRLPGSTWDMRCFHEAMTVTSVSLLADWFSFTLTDHAKSLILKTIWDKGLSIVERDMMKHEYLYSCNQGIWFCSVRIFGGLLLEKAWPRMGSYVDRAYSDLVKSLTNYILEDGGIDEGIGYFGQTMQSAIPAVFAYARSRGKDPKVFLERFVLPSDNFLSTMSGVKPGTAIPNEDCRTEYFCGDVIPVMAAYFPGSINDKILKACLASGSVYSVTGGLTGSGGIFGFIYGPDNLHKSECVVPVFSLLPKTGYLTSFRRKNDHSLLIHLSGSKAGASHSHLDRGAFTVEIDEEKVIIDRGMISYSNPAAAVLVRSCMHNIITPVLEDGSFVDQGTPHIPIIPKGHGDANRLHAEIDISSVWQHFMKSYRRSIISENFAEIIIIDEGELLKQGKIAFHLHSPFPIIRDGERIVIRKNGQEPFTELLTIQAEWAENVQCSVDLVDLRGKPVYHLVIIGKPVKDFSFKTVLLCR